MSARSASCCSPQHLACCLSGSVHFSFCACFVLTKGRCTWTPTPLATKTGGPARCGKKDLVTEVLQPCSRGSSLLELILHAWEHCQFLTESSLRRWMEKQYGHHVAASLPAESDTGLSAKKIMEEGNLPTFTLQEVSPYCSHHLSDMTHHRHAQLPLMLAHAHLQRIEVAIYGAWWPSMEQGN